MFFGRQNSFLIYYTDALTTTDSPSCHRRVSLFYASLLRHGDHSSSLRDLGLSVRLLLIATLLSRFPKVVAVVSALII